jgi:hypothetical protein
VHTKIRGKMSGRFLGELLQQRLHFCFRSPVTHSGFEPRVHDVYPVGICCHREGLIHVAIPPTEPRRQNADDLVILVIQLQCLSEHVFTTAVSALPELIA